MSDAILQERLFPGPPLSGQDRRDRWGWKALSALYQASLAQCGYQTTQVVRPEIYQTDIARTFCGVNQGDWHLAVKPIDHLRPFHGIPNVFVCDWQFPELSEGPVGDSPFFDQARLLRMADAVLCSTDFTASTLREAGIERAITLPPVIPSPPVPRFEGTGCRFLSVVDVDHMTRQLGPTIEGFALAARERTALRLVICVQGAGEAVLKTLRLRVAQAAIGLGDIITVIGAALEDGADGLLASADFFVCADAAPGLHLPLAKALLAGLPLVATMNKSTASFLPEEAAVWIATRRGILPWEDEPLARFLPLTANPASAEAVRDSVLRAASLDHDARTSMAATARKTAERRFGLDAFKAGMSQLGAFIPLETP